MSVNDLLNEPEVKALRERYHELYGGWVGLHWEGCSTIEALKKYLKEEIAAAEKREKAE